MKSTICVLTVLALASSAATANSAENPQEVTHMAFQAVDEDGKSTFTGETWVTLEGILLNNPEDWLDPTPDPSPGMFYMGGQWEIFIQGEDGDEAGTACWMGQNYGNRHDRDHPEDSYTNEEWLAELYRINYDPNSLLDGRPHVFRAGDRVRVVGRHMEFGGKRNINENHEIGDDFNFTLELLKPAVGLPQPIEITLDDLKDQNNNYIFGHDPRQGGELYQSRRVRLEDVYIIDGQWEPLEYLTVADAPSGWTRSFRVRLGYGQGILRYPMPQPTDQIDVIGIMNSSADKEYYLIALDYDGSRRVLGDATNLRGTIPGDINNDFKVDLLDFVELAEHWLMEFPGLYPRP